MTSSDERNTIAKLVEKELIDKPCWYVGTGGAAGSSFSLSLGEKVPRDPREGEFRLRKRLSKRPVQEFDYFEAEAKSIIWCTWRLDGPSAPLSSSDDVEATRTKALKELVGSHITAVSVDTFSWDVSIHFDTGKTLRVFCDHVPGDPSIETNWEVFGRTHYYGFGPGADFEYRERERLTHEYD